MKTLFTALICFCCSLGFAQSTYMKYVVRASKAEAADKMLLLPDGSAVIASWDVRDSLLHLLKVAPANGALLWTKEYHLTGNQLDQGTLNSLEYTSDNKILLGSSYLESIANSGFNNTYLAVLAFDTSGNLLWNQVDFNPDYGVEAGEIASGRSLILTSKGYAASTIFKAQAVKTNTATGAPIAAKKYSFQNRIGFSGMKGLGGKALLYGVTDNFYRLPFHYDVALAKVDTSLNVLWTKAYRDSLTNSVVDMAPYLNGGWIMICNTVFDNNKENGIVVIAVDSNGTSLWARQYLDPIRTTNGGILRLTGASIAHASDGNYLIGGMYGVPAGANSNQEGIVLKIDSIGHLISSRTYGDVSNPTAHNVDRVLGALDLGSGNYLFSGHTGFQILYGVDNFATSPRAACFSTGPAMVTKDVSSEIRDTTITLTAGAYTSPFAPVTYTTTNVSFITDTISCGPSAVRSATMNGLKVSVSPNPANETVCFELNDPLQQGELRICDVSGRQVRRVDINGKVRIAREGLQSGVYFYTVLANDGLEVRGKLVLE